MKKILFMFIAIYSLSVISNSTASFVRGNQLFNICSSNSTADNAACEGYIMAINDSIYSGHLSNVFDICLPSGVSPSQLRLAIVKYMKTIPEKLHFVADGVVAEALATTFMCRSDKDNSVEE